MFKKFIDGLVFGSGFGLAFIVIWIVAIYFLLPTIAENRIQTISSSPSTEVNIVPSIQPPGKYLGSTNISSSGFSRGGVLASGPGEIIGRAEVNGKQIEGLKLRLALNGSVYSQWATTDSTGQYAIHVPYGDYVIDGYELDQSTADKYLANKIDHPQSPHSSSRFTVSASSSGRGLNFRFVDPIIKNFQSDKFKLDDEIILNWQEYPGAATYSVQITEKSDPYGWSNTTLFEWSDKPELLEAHINLNDYDIKLKPGKFYIVEIGAKDKSNNRISESPSNLMGYDFEIIE